MNENVVVEAQEEESNINKALKAAWNKDYNSAIDILKNELLANETSYIHSLIASYYIKLNEINKAREHLNKALKKLPIYHGAYFLLGNLEFKDENYAHAVNYYLVTLLNQMDYPYANLNLAVAYSKLDLNYQSFKAYERYIKYDEDVEAIEYKEVKEKLSHGVELSKRYIEEGQKAFAINDFNRACKFYGKAIKHYPTKNVLLNLANMFFADKNYEKALFYYQNAYVLSGTNKSFIHKMALCYDKLEKYDYAYAYYDLFINSNDSKLDYSTLMNRMLILKTKFASDGDEVQNHLTLAEEYELNANYELALCEYINYYVLTKRSNTAISQKIKDLNHFLNVEKYYIKNAFKAVDMYYEKREFDEAEKLCNKICKVSKRTSSDYVNAQKFKYKIILAKGGH